MDVVSIAIALAAQGLAVLPCRADKRPATLHGYKDAVRDPAAVRELWRRFRGELVGAATGEASGFDVLDVDLDRHAEAADWWRANRHRIPPTRVHETRGRGLHVLFRAAPRLRCSAGQVARGVDVRAGGGFIIWWPAAGFRVLRTIDLAAWPARLLAELQPPPKSPAPPILLHADADARRRYAVGALRAALERVVQAREGQRNNVLNRECFALARFVRDGVLGAGELANALAIGACKAGLTSREITATLASALRAGGAA